MDMGNDLLFYESRKRAIERVKKMQDDSRKKVSEGEDVQNSSYSDYEKNADNRGMNRNQTGGFGKNSAEAGYGNYQNNQNTYGYNQYNNYGNYKSGNNTFNSSNNRGGISSLLENFTKGNGNTLNFLKGQVGEITGPLKGIMDYLDLDSEKLIIIMVMWMLFNEKADKTLLLALGYLLL